MGKQCRLKTILAFKLAFRGSLDSLGSGDKPSTSIFLLITYCRVSILPTARTSPFS